jgi:hypothetical protein
VDLDLGTVSSLCPTVLEYLSSTRWDDGSERQTSTVLVFCEEGRWKACLNDRAMDRTAFVSGNTPEGLLTNLEAALADGTVDWRRRGKSGRGRG